jgi:hypothetical protein
MFCGLRVIRILQELDEEIHNPIVFADNLFSFVHAQYFMDTQVHEVIFINWFHPTSPANIQVAQ